MAKSKRLHSGFLYYIWYKEASYLAELYYTHKDTDWFKQWSDINLELYEEYWDARYIEDQERELKHYQQQVQRWSRMGYKYPYKLVKNYDGDYLLEVA